MMSVNFLHQQISISNKALVIMRVNLFLAVLVFVITILPATATAVVDGTHEADGDLGWGPYWLLNQTHDKSAHFYLEGINQNAGLGHAFMSFNHLVTLAHQNNVTPHFTFQAEAHGLKATRVKGYFFGDLFKSPLPTDRHCTKIESSPETIEHQISDARNKSVSCAIFTIKNITPSGVGVNINLPLYRQLFNHNEGVRKLVVKRKERQQDRNVVTVSVHIRRGDLFNYVGDDRKKAELRIVAVSAYTSVLKQLSSKLMQLGKDRMHVYLFCEGMREPASIQDVNGTFVNLKRELSLDNVTFSAGDTDALQAFDDMCASDILITGTSGFSHLASILCRTPIVLAMPFWHSYDYIPNAMKLQIGKGNYTLPNMANKAPFTFTNSARFNDSHFGLLWRTLYENHI